MDAITRYSNALLEVFKAAPSKREAHLRSRPIIGDMTADRSFLSAALARNLENPDLLNRLNYPVLALDGPLNEYFSMVVNCWIPLPTRRTDISTKAVHHHGDMLLTTGNLVGPGYLHWTFSKPRLLDAEREIFALDIAESEQHAEGHVAFVDDHIPHLPWYPKELSITVCLWSSRRPTTWRDRVKRIPLLKKNEQLLRRAAQLARVDQLATRLLDLKTIEYFDFYPTEQGMRGMRVRDEYRRGPNSDHLQSLFHVLQQTNHASMAKRIREHVARGRVHEPSVVTKLLDDLDHDRAIDAKLSECHLDVPHTTFTPGELRRAIAATPQASMRATSMS